MQIAANHDLKEHQELRKKEHAEANRVKHDRFGVDLVLHACFFQEPSDDADSID